jgi:hypothetical protein
VLVRLHSLALQLGIHLIAMLELVLAQQLLADTQYLIWQWLELMFIYLGHQGTKQLMLDIGLFKRFLNQKPLITGVFVL